MTPANPGNLMERLAAALCVWCLALLPGCVFNTSGLPFSDSDAQVAPDVGTAECGDGVRDSGESCDGADFGGQTCGSLGFVGGTLGCTPECELDDSQCEIGGDCGNGQIDTAEQCDGADLGTLTCTSATGHLDGTLSCTGQCTLDTSLCHTCGDGFVEGGEMCEGPPVGRECTDEGFDGGQLGCSNCQLDTSACFTCGDGVCDGADGETPALCPADCAWVMVTAGASHTCAVAADETLWCWGLNGNGQLGIGNTTDRDQPTLVPGLTGVIAASAGAAHTCAVLSTGEAWCWGLNGDGQLGIGITTDSPSPVQVTSLAGVTVVAAGGGHTCALTGQTLWCWGLNDKGQLGDGSETTRLLPVAVSNAGLQLADWVTTGTKHTCAVALGGAAWCWGDKGGGRLGDGTDTDQPEPVLVDTTLLGLVTTLDGGDHHTCAIDVGGAAWCWGDNNSGRLGDGTSTNRPLPQPVATSTGLTQVLHITAGFHHTCAVGSGGAAWCWGDNADGQLGDGATTDQEVPTPVDATTGLTSALMITAGSLHTCALKTDHTVWCWGNNDVGQLGDGTLISRELPGPIP